MQRVIKPCKFRIGNVNRHLKLEINYDHGRLSISGEIPHYCWGQCDELLEDPNLILNPKYDQETLSKIRSIWKRWHLNDMRAGTPLQEEKLRLYKMQHPDWRYDYKEACALLEEENLLIDEGYKYGTKWLFEAVPNDVISFLFHLPGYNPANRAG